MMVGFMGVNPYSNIGELFKNNDKTTVDTRVDGDNVVDMPDQFVEQNQGERYTIHNSLLFPFVGKNKYMKQTMYIVRGSHRGRGIAFKLSNFIFKQLQLKLEEFKLQYVRRRFSKIDSQLAANVVALARDNYQLFLEVEASSLNPASFISSMKDDFILAGLSDGEILTKGGEPQIMYHMVKPIGSHKSLEYDESAAVLSKTGELTKKLEAYQTKKRAAIDSLRTEIDRLSEDSKNVKENKELLEKNLKENLIPIPHFLQI